MLDEPENDVVRVVIGLGNPGPRYEQTYHNVGFRVIDMLARRRGVSLSVRMREARVVRLSDPSPAVLVQPTTYMNLSGRVVRTLLERFGQDLSLVVVSDDLALPLGKIRIRERGSAGGHNGLKSIGSAYGSDEYVRVRVGIAPDRGVEDGKDFVLSEVSNADREVLGRAEELAADAVEHILRAGTRSAMSEYNGTDLREVES